MVTFTNRFGLPEPLFALLGREAYSRGDSRRSVTQLIDSPRLAALKEMHGQSDAIEVDISERIWALFGTAVHKLIEDGLPHTDWNLAEERVFSEINGWKVSGAVDLQLIDTGFVELYDWKVCSIWSVMKGKPEWANQLNLLAYLIEREVPITVTRLQIGALIRDWSRADAKRDPNYPQSPFHMIDIPLWDYKAREIYAYSRVRLHQQAEAALHMEEEPAPCSTQEMWVRDERWAVIKKGNKRASKVFDDEPSAQAYAAAIPDAVVEYRAGERTRCSSFCEVSKFCSLAPKGDFFGF